MRNPFKNPFKKNFTSIADQRSILKISQLIDILFPDVDARQKSSLIKAGKGTVYACTNRISNSCASAVLRLYTEKPTRNIKTRAVDKKRKAFLEKAGISHRIKSLDEVEEVTDSKALNLLNTVNRYTDQFRLRKLSWKHRCLVGDAYWYIVKTETLGIPFEIHVMPPEQVQIVEGKGFREMIGYKIGKTDYKPEEIIHFVYEDDEEKIWTYGKSPLQSVIDEYNTAGYLKMQLQDRAKTKFGTDAYIEIGENARYTEDQKKSLKEQLYQYRTGNVKADSVMTLESGSKFVPFPLADKDLPYDSNLRFLRELICNAYSVPVSFFTESSTRAIQGEQKTQYYADCITPLLIADQETLNSFYLPMFEGTEDMYFVYDSVIPEDEKLLADIYTKYVSSGIMTINQVRYERNDEPHPDGDVLLIPSTMVPLGTDMSNAGKEFAKAVKEEMEKGEIK